MAAIEGRNLLNGGKSKAQKRSEFAAFEREVEAGLVRLENR